MKTCHSNAHLSIYGMGDAPAFVMEDGMGDASAFVVKGDAPLAMRTSFTYIIGDTQYEHTFPFIREAGMSWILT
jgi:hypothetical protein